MLISKIFRKIRKYIDISKSIHLSNDEEKKLTIEIVRQLQRLLKLILSKAERDQYKYRLKLIKNPNELRNIKQYVNNKSKYQYWYKLLSFRSNYMINFSNNYEKTTLSIYNDFIKILYKSTTAANDHFYYLEAPSCETPEKINDYFEQIKRVINERKLSNIIIPSHCITNKDKFKKEHEMEYITSLVSGSIIIDITKSSHVPVCLDYLSEIIQNSHNLKFGLSFQSYLRKSIYYIHQLLAQLTDEQKKLFILRINKNNFYSAEKKKRYTQPIKNNTYYKWSMFTIMNMIRKHNIDCIVNSNSLYDIAWIQLLKSQFNVENKVIFETNRTKFPNIAKLIQILNRNSIHSEFILVPPKITTKINIIIKKLLIQNRIYNEYAQINVSDQAIFKKTHRQFFNYLQHNYLEKYLNFYSKETFINS